MTKEQLPPHQLRVEIKRRVALTNGSTITKANVSRIVAKSTRIITGHISSKFDFSNYYETWRVQHDPKKGYIFREVTTGCGISGYHKSLKSLVASALVFSHIRVYVESKGGAS